MSEAAFRFDDVGPGQVPRGWSIRQTNPTTALATWQVVADETAPSKPNVLALTRSDNYDGTFNLAIAKGTSFQDLDLSVRVKAVSGKEDQGGGPIWRCIDENNYYICRFNPLEGNFRVYKVVSGKRRQLQSVDVETEPGKWYTVQVTMIGKRIACFLDGRNMLESKDDTFPQAGKLGLWTKADAVTRFDDLVVRETVDALSAPEGLDAAKIEHIVGLKGQYDEAENVYKIAVPRTDVAVSIDQQAMHPFRGLTSWAAFQAGKRTEAMVMGDLVLFQDEVNPVMSAALDNGLTVTALHNHFFYDEPKVYFMHIGGEGTTEQLATGVRNALDTVKQVRAKSPSPAKTFNYLPIASKSNIKPEPIERILGLKGKVKDGMYKVVVGRTATMPCGCKVSAGMGVNTWAAFAGTDDHASVDGDFACLPGELQATLITLRRHGINIVAIHNHMEDEEPRVIFLHYWGVGSTMDLAKAIKATLDAQMSHRKNAANPAIGSGHERAEAAREGQLLAAAPEHWLVEPLRDQRNQLEHHLRGLDVAMVEVGYRFNELFFAGQDGNWDYAKYQIEKIELATRLAVERRPKRAASAEPFLAETIPIVKRAIEVARRTRDNPVFQDAMERLRMDCMKCHVAENIPYFTVYFPEQRSSPIRMGP